MKNQNPGFNEDLRLSDLQRYDVLHTAPEEDFDELARLISQICGCTYAAISFVGKDVQFFKAGVGGLERETRRDESFCGHTILQDDVMVVQDATLDDRFSNSSFVTGPLGIRFYAGAPILSASGQPVGSLCVFDNKPTALSNDQLKSLQIISRQVTRLLELRMMNKVIAREAEQKLKREKSALQHTLRQQDRERQSIGVALHEDFAQVLAASLMYMNIAGKPAQEDVFFEKAQQALTGLLHDMRKMSRAYNPLSLHVAAIQETMDEIINDFSSVNAIAADFDWTGDAEKIDPRTAENLLHILMEHLRQVSHKRALSEISVRVRVADDVRMRIRDNGMWAEGQTAADSPDAVALFRRIELTEGTYEYTDGRNELAILRVVMPLRQENEVKA